MVSTHDWPEPCLSCVIDLRYEAVRISEIGQRAYGWPSFLLIQPTIQLVIISNCTISHIRMILGYLFINREVKISLRQRERLCNIAVVFVMFFYTKRWTTRRFHFIVYYSDNEYEPKKNTRNDDISTQKCRCRCRSEILTSLIIDIFPSSCRIHVLLNKFSKVNY